MEVSGVKLDRKSYDFIGAGERVRPLRDRIVVKQLPWRPSKIVEIVDRERLALRGEVVAVGPGTYPWKYNADRSKRWLSPHFVPTQVKVGDIVQLEGYAYPTVSINHETHFICQEQDVCFIDG